MNTGTTEDIRKALEQFEASTAADEILANVRVIHVHSVLWLRSLLEEVERINENLKAISEESLSTVRELTNKVRQLREELEQVKKEREGVMNYLSNTEMTASGEPAMIFIEMLVGLFEQNGGKNFLTLTVERKDKSERYSVTIQNLNGDLSPAEKMQILQDEAESLRSELAAKDKVLEWYGDEGNYKPVVHETLNFIDEPIVTNDEGLRARIVIAKHATINESKSDTATTTLG